MSSMAEEMHMTENGMVLVLDSVESEKEILSILESGVNRLASSLAKDRNKLKLQNVKKIAKTWIINDDHMLSVEGLRPGEKRVLGLMLMKKFGPNKNKIKPQLGNDGCTYVCFKSAQDMKIAQKLLNTRGISNHKVIAKEVTAEKQMQGLQFDLNEYKEHVVFLDEQIRKLVMQMQMRLLQNIPACTKMVNEKQVEYDGMLCEIASVWYCTPKREPYHSCCFVIVEHHETGLPVLLMRDSSGKMKRNWKKRNYYDYNILTAASIFEKLVVSSKWNAAKGGSGFWRKLIIRSNEKGELLLWLEVQSAQYSALDEVKSLQMLFMNYFERGIGRKCKVTSVYVQVIFIDGALKVRKSLIKLIMGNALFEEAIAGLQIKMQPQFSALKQIARPEILCKLVQDLVMPVDNVSVIIVGTADNGVVGLHLAESAGEVLFIDRLKAINIVKFNMQKNELVSKCTAVAGVTEEELPRITLQHSVAYAFVTLPSFQTAAACRAMTTLRDEPLVKKIVLWLDPSKPFGLLLKMLVDPTLSGIPFFPQKIIPFDTILSEKHFMFLMVLDRIESRGSPLSNLVIPYKNKKFELRGKHSDYADMREKVIHNRSDVYLPADPYKKELSAAREKISALQRKKEKIEAELRSIDFHKRPNLVIEVKREYTQHFRDLKPSTECEMRYGDIELEVSESNEMDLDENSKRNKVSRIVAVTNNELYETVKGDSQPELDEEIAFYLKKVVAGSSTGLGILSSNKTWPVKKYTSDDEIKAPHGAEERVHGIIASSSTVATSGKELYRSSTDYEEKPINKKNVTVTIVRQTRAMGDSYDSYSDQQARCYNSAEQDFDVKRNSNYAPAKKERGELPRLKVRITTDQDFKRSSELYRENKFEHDLSTEHQSLKRQSTYPRRESDFQNTKDEYHAGSSITPSGKHDRDDFHYSRSSPEFQSSRRQSSKIHKNDLEPSYHMDTNNFSFKKDRNGRYDKNDVHKSFEEKPYSSEIDTRNSQIVRNTSRDVGREFEEKRYLPKMSSYNKYADHEYKRQRSPPPDIGRKAEDMHSRNKYMSHELSPISKRVKSTVDSDRGTVRSKERGFYPSDEHSYPASKSYNDSYSRKLPLQNRRNSKESDTHFYQQERKDMYEVRETYPGKRKLHDETHYENSEKTPYKRTAVDYYGSSTKEREIPSDGRPPYKKKTPSDYYEADTHPHKERAADKRRFPSGDREHVQSYKFYNTAAPVKHISSERSRSPHRKEKTWASTHTTDARGNYPEPHSRETCSSGTYYQKTSDQPSNHSRYSHPESTREATSKHQPYDAAEHHSQQPEFSYPSNTNYENDTRVIKDIFEREGYEHHYRNPEPRISDFAPKEQLPYSHTNVVCASQPYRVVPIDLEPNNRQHMIPTKVTSWERQH